LSERTADVLGFREKGKAYVNVTILSEPSMELKNALLNNGKQDPNAIDAPSQRVDNVRTSGIKAAALDSQGLAKGVDPDNPPPLDTLSTIVKVARAVRADPPCWRRCPAVQPAFR
jgi:rare lipoprotein A (peptidoglycan hydrolase)